MPLLLHFSPVFHSDPGFIVSIPLRHFLLLNNLIYQKGLLNFFKTNKPNFSAQKYSQYSCHYSTLSSC